ncbi:MAG: glycosyltransferase family 2 protein [Candidatus Liptonbacteria bacterium]|nr:glycosyltransferase family 2 protein [Candidatus Liptonbacteria bacterium]
MPKISAIITTWNRALMLHRAISSVLGQTFTEFELLILDNSSSDNTADVVKEFNDPRIYYIRHAPGNISWARNLGVRESRGEFLAFLDDDDEWLPNKLEDQYQIFKEDKIGKTGLVYGAYFHITAESGKIFETIFPKLRGHVYNYVISHRDTLTGSASNPLLRKSAVIKVGSYDENVTTGEDYEMFLRLSKEFYFDYVKKPLVNIYVHQGYRLSYRLEDYLNTELTVYKKHHSFITSHPRVHLLFLQIIAGKLIRLARPKEAREYLKKALAVKSFHPRTWLQYLLSFLPNRFYHKGHVLAVSWYHSRERSKRSSP